MVTSSNAKLLYLSAASHSGSTLAAMLLGAQRRFVTVGELRGDAIGDPSTYRCSCGELIGACSFWTAVLEQASTAVGEPMLPGKMGTSFGHGPSAFTAKLMGPLVRNGPLEWGRQVALHLDPRWRHFRASARSHLGALVQALATQADARVVVDSSKIGWQLSNLIGIDGIDLRVVHYVRDGRAVALTYMRPAEFAATKDAAKRSGGAPMEFSRPMPEAAREWRRSNEEAEAILARLPASSWIRVQYEDLCRDPKATIARIAEFVGEPLDEVNLRFRAGPTHVVGNGMRLDDTEEIVLDERWRDVLSREDLAQFEAEAGPMLRRYGYK